jgi:hypothetical protein
VQRSADPTEDHRSPRLHASSAPEALSAACGPRPVFQRRASSPPTLLLPAGQHKRVSARFARALRMIGFGACLSSCAIRAPSSVVSRAPRNLRPCDPPRAKHRIEAPAARLFPRADLDCIARVHRTSPFVDPPSRHLARTKLGCGGGDWCPTGLLDDAPPSVSDVPTHHKVRPAVCGSTKCARRESNPRPAA